MNEVFAQRRPHGEQGHRYQCSVINEELSCEVEEWVASGGSHTRRHHKELSAKPAASVLDESESHTTTGVAI